MEALDRDPRSVRPRFGLVSRAPSLLAAVVALVLVAVAAPAEAQSTKSKLDDARRRVSTVKSRYERLTEEFVRHEYALSQTRVRITRTTAEIQRSEEELGALQSQLKARIRRAYREGGLGFFEFILEARSFRDFSVRFITLQRQSLSDEDLILKMRKKRAELESQQAALREERAERERQVASTKAQARRLTITFAQARQIERELQGQLAQEEIAKLFRVGGTSTGGVRIPLDACPVNGPHSFSNDWGAPRGGGSRRHQGNDILAPSGTPIAAPVSGTISKARSGGGLGGVALYLWGNDQNEYYFAHNTRNVAGVGQKVSAGQTIATVGNTGNASGGPAHLHFEIHPGGGGAVNPYPSLITVC